MRDSDSTATQANIGRRELLRKGSAVAVGSTAAAAGGSHLAGSPVSMGAAINLRDAALYGLAGPIGVLAFGDVLGGPDSSEVADSLEWKNAVAEYTRSREDRLATDETLASLKRDVQLIESKAREEAIFRIYEKAVDSGTEAEATTAAETAIDETYAVVQEAVLSSFSQRLLRADAVINMFGVVNWATGNTPELEHFDSEQGADMGKAIQNSDETNEYAIGSSSFTLFDGRTLSYYSAANPSTTKDFAAALDPVVWQSMRSETWSQGLTDQLVMLKPDPANYNSRDDPLDVSYDSVMFLDGAAWGEIYDKLKTGHTTLLNEVSDMVNSYFTPAQDGDLDLNNALGPSYLADTASTAEDFEEAALAMRSLGYPISDQAVVFSFASSPDQEINGRLAWTAHNGDTLPVGESITPSNTVGSIFAAANNTEVDGSMTGKTFEISEPFTILEASPTTTEISFKDRTLAETDTTSEEIETVFRENQKANEEATEVVHETATSGGTGGGGFLDGGGSDAKTLGIVAGGAALLALLLGNN